MTIIVVVADKKHVTIASDRTWSGEFGVTFSRSKLTPIMAEGEQVGAMAASGDARTGSALEERISAALRARDPECSIRGTLQAAFDEARDALKEWTWADSDTLCESEMMLVIYGRGYCLDEGWQVYELDFSPGSLALNAIGCGSEIALGAMWSTAKDPAEVRAHNACLAACELHSACGPPIDVFTMGRESS